MIFTLNAHTRHRVKDAIDKSPDGWVVTLAKPKRRLQANNLFHKWMQVVSSEYAEATGKFYPAAHWKKYFKDMFLGQESVEINGRFVTIDRKTSELNIADMNEFMTKVDHYCGSELHIFLPSPNVPEEA